MGPEIWTYSVSISNYSSFITLCWTLRKHMKETWNILCLCVLKLPHTSPCFIVRKVSVRQQLCLKSQMFVVAAHLKAGINSLDPLLGGSELSVPAHHHPDHVPLPLHHHVPHPQENERGPRAANRLRGCRNKKNKPVRFTVWNCSNKNVTFTVTNLRRIPLRCLPAWLQSLLFF